MASTVDEIERKYEGAQLTAEMLAGLPKVAAVLGPDHHTLGATYYDTGDGRLARAGITLRARHGGDDPGWHAKLPVSAEHRREIQLPLTSAADTADGGHLVPARLTELLLAVTGGRRLRAVARIGTERDRWQLAGADGKVLVEVANDTVRAQRLGQPAGAVELWQEVEVELVAGERNLLNAVSDRLAGAGLVRSREASKLTRILHSPPAESATIHLAKDASAAEVLTAYAQQQISALRTADIALRLDEPHAVHDLRVAVRRLRSWLRVFRPMVRRQAHRWLAVELKWLSDLLGAARDVEVLRRRVTNEIGRLRTELVLGPVHAEVDRLLARREATAMATLRGALSEQRYLDVHRALGRLRTEPPYRRIANRAARVVLPTQVRKAHGAVRRAVITAARAPRGARRDAALHQVRKDVKRLRYACAAIQPVIGKPATKLRKRSKKIQGVLGNHHDYVALRDLLRELGAQAQLNGNNGFTFGLVHGSVEQRALRAEGEFTKQYQRLAKPKARRWLRR